MTDRMPGFNTLAIHAGAAPDPTTGARATPIYQTTSFVFDDVDHAASLFGLQAFGNIYSRIGNPTCAVLEERVAALEGGTAGLAVASGHAAEFLTMHALMQPGDEFVAANKLYGGSINQFNHSYKNFGWNVRWADADDPSSFEAAVTPRTKAFFVESIANPGGVIVDLEAIDDRQASQHPVHRRQHDGLPLPHPAVRVRRRHRRPLGDEVPGRARQLDRRRHRRRRLVQLDRRRPLSDAVEAAARIRRHGAGRDLRQLRLRDRDAGARASRHGTGAVALQRLPDPAEHLDGHKAVTWVSYPGLRGDRYHNLAKRYCPKGAGAVFTFGLEGGYDAGVRLVSNLRLFSHLANIGDTRSLVIHPASTTHRQLTDEQRKSAGAGPEVVRLSIGLEDTEDLIADLDQALDAAA